MMVLASCFLLVRNRSRARYSRATMISGEYDAEGMEILMPSHSYCNSFASNSIIRGYEFRDSTESSTSPRSTSSSRFDGLSVTSLASETRKMYAEVMRSSSSFIGKAASSADGWDDAHDTWSNPPPSPRSDAPSSPENDPLTPIRSKDQPARPSILTRRSADVDVQAI